MNFLLDLDKNNHSKLSFQENTVLENQCKGKKVTDYFFVLLLLWGDGIDPLSDAPVRTLNQRCAM